MKDAPRYLMGYLVGFALFIVLIPLGFYGLSKLDHIFCGMVLIGPATVRYILFAVCLLTGATFAAWSNLWLYRIGKGGPTDAFGVSISPQTKILVTTGPYRYSRNPMVFGAFSIYASVVILLNSIAGLIAWLLLLGLVLFFLKYSEEKRLTRDFGDEYLEYKKRVPMIFPLKLRKIRH